MLFETVLIWSVCQRTAIRAKLWLEKKWRRIESRLQWERKTMREMIVLLKAWSVVFNTEQNSRLVCNSGQYVPGNDLASVAILKTSCDTYCSSQAGKESTAHPAQWIKEGTERFKWLGGDFTLPHLWPGLERKPDSFMAVCLWRLLQITLTTSCKFDQVFCWLWSVWTRKAS